MRKVISTLVLASVAVSANAMDPVVKGVLAGVAGTIIVQQMTKQHNPPPTVEIRQGPAYAVAPGQVVGVPIAIQPYIVPCDEQYFNGVYDPKTAYQYCRGVRERYMREWNQRAHDAYNLGLRGY